MFPLCAAVFESKRSFHMIKRKKFPVILTPSQRLHDLSDTQIVDPTLQEVLAHRCPHPPVGIHEILSIPCGCEFMGPVRNLGCEFMGLAGKRLLLRFTQPQRRFEAIRSYE